MLNDGEALEPSMYLFVVSLHVILSLILILVILLQPGKGSDPGAAFGGGMAGSMFGPRGPATLLTRATTAVAVLFMVTSVSLALYSNRTTVTGGDLDEELRLLQEQDAADTDEPGVLAPGLEVGPGAGASAPGAGAAPPAGE